jgi:ubiquinone/menaquinone biosynthesis C-methylase UbiE
MASTSRGTDQAVSFLARILLRMFGRPQGVLGRLGGIIMARMNRNLAGRTIALLDVQPHDRVLEIGFGPGVGIELLSGVVSSGHVAGVDVSEEMVEQARMRNVEAIQRGKVELRRGSVEALPFAPEMFDKAMAINAMQVWPDAVAGLRESWRVLKPGGRVALGFTPYAGQPRAGLTDVLTTAGFAGAQVVDIERDFCALAIKS